jgi:uracil-DNA glycosylase family 4
MPNSAASLTALNAQIEVCARCPRLREYSAEIAHVKRRAYANQEYWGRPVPSFGDPKALVLILGLAPGAHGSNRTGRMFTGDGSGDFLYPVLYDAGFASQPYAVSRDDGMKLTSVWISAVVHCAPPDNKPTPGEQRNCSAWVDEEIPLLRQLRVVVCLGKIAFDGFLGYAMRSGQIEGRSKFPFRHGAEFVLPSGLTLVASYHPSLQNTNTGKLTRTMFLDVFMRARAAAGLE